MGIQGGMFSTLGSVLLFAAQTAVGQPAALKGDRLDVDIRGNLYVLDTGRGMLRLCAPDGTLMQEVGGTGWQQDQFDHPMGLWARNGLDVFVADFGNHRIQRFDKNLAFVSSLSTRDSDNPDQRFGYPLDVSISRLGELYICDSENERIVKVGASNTVERTFGGYGAGTGRLFSPAMAKCGPGDNLYVLDPPRVLVFDTFGNALGELAPGMLTHPIAIAADQHSVAVLDSVQLLFFGAGNRMEGAIPLSALGKPGVTCCALANDSLYLLGPSGLTVIPVPHQPER